MPSPEDLRGKPGDLLGIELSAREDVQVHAPALLREVGHDAGRLDQLHRRIARRLRVGLSEAEQQRLADAAHAEDLVAQLLHELANSGLIPNRLLIAAVEVEQQLPPKGLSHGSNFSWTVHGMKNQVWASGW